MSSPNPQHEPTMEEILASIRKIISEDQPEGGNGAAAPVAVAMDPAPSADIDVDVDVDVLELTEEVADENAPKASPAPQPLDNDIAFEAIEEPKHGASAMQPDDLISDSARSALDRAISHLNSADEAPPAPSGALDALFMRAIQDAFVPALYEWVDGRHDEIMAELKPLIREWMDRHLPPLIESAVAKEIARAVPGRRR